MVSSTTTSYVGHFNDGQTAASHEVQVTLGADGILFGPAGKPPAHHWAYDDLRAVKPTQSSGPAWLSYSPSPDARLIVGSAQFAQQLVVACPQVGPAANAQRIAGIVFTCLAGLAIVVGIAWILLSFRCGWNHKPCEVMDGTTQCSSTCTLACSLVERSRSYCSSHAKSSSHNL